MTAPASVQECIVCSSDSRTRCSACAAVGIDLFFCSAECQKLVWKAHRPVCARNPFPLPDVSPEEAAAFAATANTPMTAFGDVTTTEAQRISLVSGLPAETALRRLAGPTYDPTYPYKAMLVLNMRVSMSADSGRRASQQSAMDCLATYAMLPLSNLFVDELLPEDLGSQPWFAALLHRALIVGALISRGGTSDPQDPRTRLAYLALSVYQTWLQGGMGTGDSRFVEALKDNDFFAMAQNALAQGAPGLK
ncbi:hypothetical protein JCM10450v2_003506 [Rhodotorula kratochvilovae]